MRKNVVLWFRIWKTDFLAAAKISHRHRETQWLIEHGPKHYELWTINYALFMTPIMMLTTHSICVLESIWEFGSCFTSPGKLPPPELPVKAVRVQSLAIYRLFEFEKVAAFSNSGNLILKGTNHWNPLYLVCWVECRTHRACVRAEHLSFDPDRANSPGGSFQTKLCLLSRLCKFQSELCLFIWTND